MLNSYVFYNVNTKLVEYVATPSDPTIYKDGQQYGDKIAILLTKEMPSLEVMHNTWHWNVDGFSTHAPNTNPDFIWDPVSLSYIAPIGYFSARQNRAKLSVNSMAGNKILALYPDYKQRNMTARYLELVTLNETDSAEALTIKAAWDWIKDIRNRSNVSYALVEQATTIEELDSVLSNFKTELDSIV